MQSLELLALRAWSASSSEGLLVVDLQGNVCRAHGRLLELLGLTATPPNVAALLKQVTPEIPGLRSVLLPSQALPCMQTGTLTLDRTPPQHLTWQRIPLSSGETLQGYAFIFREATGLAQFDLARQSFLSMVSHDLRTPLSTILGFAELLHYNRGSLTEAEQTEFVEHILTNANALSRYTQIALDVLYLEADQRPLQTDTVRLNVFVRHWLADALHRYSADRLVYADSSNGRGPLAQIAPSAVHRILSILTEFALAETPSGEPITVGTSYGDGRAHITLEHHAPGLSEEEAAALFRQMHPRDLSESGRPSLHRMQLYVASLLAQRQQGTLTLHSYPHHRYQFDLAVPLDATQVLPDRA